MIDETGGGFLKLIWSVVWEFFFGTLCYFIGWPVCKLITLGRYPPSESSIDNAYSRQKEGLPCTLVGFVTLVTIIVFGVDLA